VERLRFLRRLVPAVLAAVFLLASAGEPVAARPQATSTAIDVLHELNLARARRGLAPLRISRPLTAAAEYHTRDMGTRGYFSHTSRDGTSFSKRVRRFYPADGYRVWLAGENLLWMAGTLDAERAVRMWMESRGHRANILSRRWREVGISARSFAAAPGTFRGRDVTIVTADFGTRLPG
jgi:uncharacterized protein YkwD